MGHYLGLLITTNLNTMGHHPKDVVKVMEITYIGHSTVLMAEQEFTILTDPFFSPSFLRLKRQRLPARRIEELPSIDLILISHTHPDHCDYGALEKLSKSSRVIMPRGTAHKVRKMGFAVEELNDWESTTFGTYPITAIPAKHQGKCVGYVIEGSQTIYFAGDTFFTSSIIELGQKRDIDVALLPIGGNRFLGKKMVMDAQQAARAAEVLRPDIVIPIHFGTFGQIPFLFSMKGNPSELVQLIQDAEIKAAVRVLDIGECLQVI